jgi:hypothetical protein
VDNRKKVGYALYFIENEYIMAGISFNPFSEKLRLGGQLTKQVCIQQVENDRLFPEMIFIPCCFTATTWSKEKKIRIRSLKMTFNHVDSKNCSFMVPCIPKIPHFWIYHIKNTFYLHRSQLYIEKYAGHNGLVGSALMRTLKKKGFSNLVYRSHSELDLTNQPAVERFFIKDELE